MNFSDFSFWWILLLYSVPFFTVRYIAKSLNQWRDIFDTFGLIAMSVMLFFNASLSSFIIFACEVVFNYFMLQFILRLQGSPAKFWLGVLIAINIGILAYFKYLTFFVENVWGLVFDVSKDWHDDFPLPVFHTIPPGVSFYTFEMVAFAIDSFNARRRKPVSFISYVNFMVFFPKIVAGPIERRSDLLPQLDGFKFKFTVENFEEGLRWLSLGAFMKFVLGDNLASYIKLENATNPWIIWFFAFLFTLRIYFDFAGYSFIAMGLAKFLGVNLTINFLAPYTSQSINEFWRRWHITLSTWFRDYVFIPLMGSQKQLAPLFLFITFTLSGFWHGAAWNFIIWGAYHGALLLLLRYLGRPFHSWVSKSIPQPLFISWALTFGSVVFGCLFFMETNSGRLFQKLKTLFNPLAYSGSNLQEFFSSYSINQGVLLVFLLLLSIGVLVLEQIGVWQQNPEEKENPYKLLLSGWLSPILLGMTFLFASTSSAGFIYFEF